MPRSLPTCAGTHQWTCWDQCSPRKYAPASGKYGEETGSFLRGHQGQHVCQKRHRRGWRPNHKVQQLIQGWGLAPSHAPTHSPELAHPPPAAGNSRGSSEGLDQTLHTSTTLTRGAHRHKQASFKGEDASRAQGVLPLPLRLPLRKGRNKEVRPWAPVKERCCLQVHLKGVLH